MCFPLPWADAPGAARTRTASATTVERAPSASLGRMSSLLGAGGKTDHADATPPAAARSTAARRRYDGTRTRRPVRGGIGVPMQLPAALIALVVSVLLVAAPGAGALPDRDQRAGPRDVRSPAWQRLGLQARRYLVAWDWARTGQQAEVAALHARGARRRQDVLVTFTAHRGCFNGRRYVPRALLPRPERARLPRRVPPVRRPLPVGAHVRRLERGQPHLATDVPPAAARRALLPRAAPRAPPARLPRPRRRRARHREPAPVPAGVPAARPGTSAALGAAQLPGREPGHGRRHAPDARASSAARCGSPRRTGS